MRTVFLFWRNGHDLKSALFFRFEQNLRPVSRFWKLWRSKMRFGQSLLRMTWKEHFVQFSWKAHCFSALKRIWGQFHDFENFDAQKCDLAKTCCAWPEKSVLYTFHGKRTVFQFWREFEASFTILRTLALKNQIWPKRAAHDLKSGFCTIFLEAHCFSVLKRISGQFYNFENFDPQKCDLAKTCCAWPEKSVLNNFHGERTVFQFWREFQASVTILKIWRSKMRFGQNVLRMTWKERFLQFSWKAHCFAPHGLVSTFCTIFIQSLLFSRIGVNFSPVERFLAPKRWQMRFGTNVLSMAWKESFVQFLYKAYCFHVLAWISVR